MIALVCEAMPLVEAVPIDIIAAEYGVPLIFILSTEVLGFFTAYCLTKPVTDPSPLSLLAHYNCYLIKRFFFAIEVYEYLVVELISGYSNDFL